MVFRLDDKNVFCLLQVIFMMFLVSSSYNLHQRRFFKDEFYQYIVYSMGGKIQYIVQRNHFVVEVYCA